MALEGSCMALTRAATLAAIRALGLTATYSPAWREYVINYRRGDTRRTAESDYRTNDAADALDSARYMAKLGK